MKPGYSKNQLRNEIRRQTEEYLARGGSISQHAQGETGQPAGPSLAHPTFVSGEPRQTRTYLNDVTSALDARKRAAKKPPLVPRRRPKKKIIYDDFGEPLREVWVDG